MSNKERKTLKVVSAAIFVGMLICLFFAWQSSRHSNDWHFGLYALLLVNSFVMYRRTRNLPQPDTLTRLFPKPTQQPSESPKH